MKTIPKHNFKQGLPHEFEIVDLGTLFQGYSQAMSKPHRAEFYQIIWFQKGSCTHHVDFNPQCIEPNTILFVNKGSVQQFDPRGNFTGKSILFTDDFFCKTDSDSKFLKSTPLFNDLFSVSQIQLTGTTPLFRDMFTLMEAESSEIKDKYQSDILRNTLRNLVMHCERLNKQQSGFTDVKKGTHLDCVLLFKDLLEEQFHTQKQVSYYAEHLHVTTKRLNLATADVLGISPKQMIDARIILEAKRLLVHTNSSVKEIGFSLGFEEPTNFVKYVRKHIHSTPLEFRTKNRT